MMIRFYMLILIVCLFNGPMAAQNITGTWEGIMGHEYLEINIKDKNGKICGYTYDHFLNDPREYCKAYFTGSYNQRRQEWILTGNEFIENSGSHVLMEVACSFSINNKYLIAYVRQRSALRYSIDDDRGVRVILRRVSRTPQPPPGLPLCYEPPRPKPLPPLAKPAPKPPVTSRPQPKPKITVPKDTTRPEVPVIVKKDPVISKPVSPARDTVAKKVTARKRSGLRRLEVNVKNITLDVYDNGIIDGDTVSIFFNGKLLVNKKLLSAKPLTFKLELDVNASSNEVVMYAENLGSIPPNTALIIVTAGDKRYELHSSANLEENAVLVFDYVPR